MEKLFIGFEMELPEGVMKEDIERVEFKTDKLPSDKVIVTLHTGKVSLAQTTRWMRFVYCPERTFVTLMEKKDDAYLQSLAEGPKTFQRYFNRKMKEGKYKTYSIDLMAKKDLYAHYVEVEDDGEVLANAEGEPEVSAGEEKKETKKRSKRK